jgi:addiction module HigA family antidote
VSAVPRREGAPPPRRPVSAGRRPQHPGQFLDSRFLKPLALSQEALARELGISRRRINEIVNGRRGLTADTALRLARYFGTGPELWLHLQAAWDLHRARLEYQRRS